MKADHVDMLDRTLVRALQLDGRVPFSRLAVVLGVSDQTVARRYRRLQEVADLRVLGLVDELSVGGEHWVLRILCEPAATERIAHSVARRADSQYVALVSDGAEALCSVLPHGARERDRLILELLPRTPGVVSVAAHCVLHRLSRRSARAGDRRRCAHRRAGGRVASAGAGLAPGARRAGRRRRGTGIGVAHYLEEVVAPLPGIWSAESTLVLRQVKELV